MFVISLKDYNYEYPIKYKLKCGYDITIKHVLVRDWYFLEGALELLQIDKNETKDESLLSLSYIDFIKKITEENKVYNLLLTTLFGNVIEDMNGKYVTWDSSNGKTVYVVLGEEKEVLFYITSKDFENIREIILRQNIYNYNPISLHPLIKKAMLKKREMESKNSSNPSLETQKIFIMGKTGFKKKEIDEMTYREFSQLFKIKIEEDIYMVKNIIKSGYSCTIEGNIQYPLFEKEKGVLDDILSDASSFKNKIEQVNNN